MPLSTAANCEYTTTNIPAFLSKLWTLVEDPKYNELIAWDPVNEFISIKINNNVYCEITYFIFHFISFLVRFQLSCIRSDKFFARNFTPVFQA